MSRQDFLAASPNRVGRVIEATEAATGEVPLMFNRTDSGNAELLASLYGDIVRFDHRRKRWLLYRDHRWCVDSTAEVLVMAKEAARFRYHQADKLYAGNDLKQEALWSIQSEQRQRIDAMLALARSVAPIADSGTAWDAYPMMLAVKNGVVDLETGILREGSPYDRLVLHTPLVYDASARCDRFEQFIREIFCDQMELIDFVQRALGYSITGNTTEQVLFICSGTGGNGKSVLLNTVGRALGEFAYNMPFATIELHARSGIPNDLAALVSKRFITASETNANTKLNEARIKALTGSDPITARFLHSEFFTFQPEAKFWLSVNHKPVVVDDSHGFWRRLRIIPFVARFDGNDDPTLETTLRSEMPGILAWLVRGCLAWQKNGLTAPSIVLNATEEYRMESDPVGQFIRERCMTETGCSARASQLYGAYVSWCDSQGFQRQERMTSTAFGRRLGEGFSKTNTRNGVVYEGINIRV